MPFLLVLLQTGVTVCATPTLKPELDGYVTMFKDFAYLPTQQDADHVAGLQQIASEAEVFSAKAANAMSLLVELRETDKEQWETAVNELRSIFDDNFDKESSVSLSSTMAFAPFCATNGTVCEKIDEDTDAFFMAAQDAITFRYSDLRDKLRSRNKDTLKNFCTHPRLSVATMCMLRVYATVLGQNCSGPEKDVCPSNITIWLRSFKGVEDANGRWRIPQTIHECVNEQIVRVSSNGSVLNRLARYARRNAFLAFNFISLCSYFAHSPDEERRESVNLVRYIADGIERSMQSAESDWSDTAKIVAAKILKSAALKLPSQMSDTSYNDTAYAIAREFKWTWFRHDYSVAVYYAYTGQLEDSAFVFKDNNVTSFDESVDNIKVFASRSQLGSAKRVCDRWNRLQNDVKRIADSLLADSSPSLETRFRNVEAQLDDRLLVEEGFSAAVLVQCAYRFVWFELAWYYFHAYGTTSPYVIEYPHDNGYKSTCGVVILFP